MSRPQSLAAAARDAGLSPGTVYARDRAGWPADRLYAPPGTHYHSSDRKYAPTDPALWERLEAARKAAHLSAAAVNRAIGAHRSWYGQQRAARHALPDDTVERIEAAIKSAASKLVKAAVSVL